MQKLYLIIKRFFDVICALLGLVVTSPIWLVAVIGILCSDPGPIFYVAERVGLNNENFKMFKFRSMTVSKYADEKSFRADVSRIFPFGAFMRKSKIDELPQLINLLIGDMSVVGPRPAAKDQLDIVRGGKYAVASVVKPGLTGPAALYDYIYGDSVTDPDEYEKKVLPTRLELEAYYPLHMNLLYEIKIVLYTIVCIYAYFMHKDVKNIYVELISVIKKEKRDNVTEEETYNVR